MKIKFKDLVEARKVLKKFRELKTDEEIFYELCFCLCTPQTTFKNNIKVLEELKKMGFYEPKRAVATLPVLHMILKPVRFYKQKADRIIKAKENFSEILKVLRVALPFCGFCPEENFQRTWLVKNVKGLGYKTASHFLRNLGADNLAIIDTHILKYMKIEDKKWNYQEVEKRFRKRAKRYGLTVAELDVIVWKVYSKTEWNQFTH